MVAHVLRLRAALLVGALRGDGRHVARLVTGIVFLVAAVGVAFVGILSLRATTVEVASVVVITAGSAVTLGFALAPVIAGSTDPVDPRRFLLFGMAPLPLSGALLLASMVSIPVLSVAALAVAVAIVWTSFGVPVVAAIVGSVLGVVTIALAARVCMALVSLVIQERRSRELTGVFILTVLVVVVPVAVFFASLEWRGSTPPALRSATEILAMTPLGAAWAYPARVAAGDPGAVGTLIVAILTLAALIPGWMALVVRLATTLERPTTTRDRSTLGWFAMSPGTPGGAVAARSLVYWLRDRRYLANLAAVPVAAALTVVPLVIAGVPLPVAILVPVPVMALFFGWLPHNDLAYDSTAIWLHIASGVRGRADRIGRLVPALLLAIPVLAICIPVVVAIQGRWAVLPGLIGVCVCLLFAGLGLSSIASAVAPYAVSRPGESPFQQPQRTGAGGALSQAGVFLGSLIVAVPIVWWAWLGLTGESGFSYLAFWAGIAVGTVVLLGGIAVGAAVFEKSGSRLMEFAESA